RGRDGGEAHAPLRHLALDRLPVRARAADHHLRDLHAIPARHRDRAALRRPARRRRAHLARAVRKRALVRLVAPLAQLEFALRHDRADRVGVHYWWVALRRLALRRPALRGDVRIHAIGVLVVRFPAGAEFARGVVDALELLAGELQIGVGQLLGLGLGDRRLG